MRTFIAVVCLLALTQVASAQFYPDRYGYAWYPRQYAEGYYRAPYYGGGLGPSCGYFGCYARPAPRFSWHYAPSHYGQFHYRRADRDGWAYQRGFGRW